MSFRCYGKATAKLWTDDKQRVFGYTPNYLKVGCVISNDVSVENQTINCSGNRSWCGLCCWGAGGVTLVIP